MLKEFFRWRQWILAGTFAFCAAQSAIADTRADPCGQPPDKPAHILRPLAEAGSANAQYQLALKYDVGIGVDKNPALAAKLYRQAVDQEHLAALQALGIMYLQGRGRALPRNTQIGLDLLRLAANEGWPCTPSVLGFYLTIGLFDVPQDFEEGAMWLRVSAEHDDDFAQWLLADLYSGNTRAKADHIKSLKWVIIAEQNSSSNLGRIRKIREGLIPQMSADQIAEAARRAQAWLARHGK